MQRDQSNIGDVVVAITANYAENGVAKVHLCPALLDIDDLEGLLRQELPADRTFTLRMTLAWEETK